MDTILYAENFNVAKFGNFKQTNFDKDILQKCEIIRNIIRFIHFTEMLYLRQNVIDSIGFPGNV